MRDFTDKKRIVIKIGTNTLSGKKGINVRSMKEIAKQIHVLLKERKQLVIVTSGAIGMGAVQLGFNRRITGTKMRQACAAIGQPLLMREYRRVLSKYRVVIGQVLLTADVLSHRKAYLNLRNALETLLNLGVLPIINENDSVSTDEIGSAFGDNDTLSALVASKIDADLLIILSDIDALYDKDPKKYTDAKPLSLIREVNDELLRSAGSSGSIYGTGGMRTKLKAVKIAANAGCSVIIAHGREKNVVPQIVSGKEIGTLFLPKRRLRHKHRWLMNSKTEGLIIIDEGAVQAIRANKSLLPKGIKSIHGNFHAGDVIMLNDAAKAITRFSSEELRLLAGKHTGEIDGFLGPGRKSVVARSDSIVLLED